MKIDGVILAAGLSSRMGTWKMSLKVERKTVLENCVESMYDFCSGIIVVGGHKYRETSELLRPYGKVQMVLNNNYLEGMFSSVKAGLSKVHGQRFFLTPGDYPLIKSETYGELLKYKDDIVVPSFKGERGHPLFMNSNLICEVTNNSIYASMRDFIDVHGFATAAVEDRGILMDIDTIKDYRRVLQMR